MVSLGRYDESVYPHDLLNRFVRLIDPDGAAELVVRTSLDAPPLHHQNPSDLGMLVRSRHPRDGVHIVLSDRSSHVMVLDVDLSGPMSPMCTCSGGGRLICDHCWVTMCGVLRGYCYLLRAHFGCEQRLACFSGGRGWHLYVLDAHQIDHASAVHVLSTLVPDTVRHVAESYLELSRLTPRHVMLTLDVVDPAARLPLPEKATHSELADAHMRALVDRRVLLLYRDVMLPYFLTIWRPRVLGCDVAEAEAIDAITAMLTTRHESHPSTCKLCPAVALCRSTVGDRPALLQRIDVFLVVMSLLWQTADEHVTTSKHPVRLPWSSHERSGRFSLPLAVERAHELRPQSLPARVEDVSREQTMSHAWFQSSLRVVSDLLHQCERGPRLAVWPT